ncbi:MAG: cell division protein ZapA [Bacillota bacterium]
MEDKDKNRITVNIMGEEYVLRSSSSKDHMHRVGNYVDRLMKSLAEKNIQMSKQRIAVLTALNLADELIRLKEEKESSSAGSEDQKGDSEDNELV